MKRCIVMGWYLALAAVSQAEIPRLIGHRGASHRAPENTLAAFRLAWEEGADGIEGDFHLSADGEVVCIHDPTTKRVAGRDLVVRKSAWAELAKLDVGAWKGAEFKGERMPKLDEVLAVVPEGKLFFLEIKGGVEMVAPIGEILRKRKASPEQVVLICFEREVIAGCRKALPEYQAHWLSSLKEFGGKGRADHYFEELRALGAQGLQFNATAPVTAGWLEKVKESGHVIDAWTVDDVALAKRMAGLGVDFISTNRPGPLRAEWLE